MTTIILNKFKGSSFAQVYGVIMGCADNSFDVQLLRTHVAGGENTYEVILDYYKAAFVGDKLAEISSIFNYWTPSVFTTEPFAFHIEVADKELLVDVIYFIVHSHLDDEYGCGYQLFEDEALAHYTAALNDEGETSCWGLLDIASEYIKILDEEACII